MCPLLLCGCACLGFLAAREQSQGLEKTAIAKALGRSVPLELIGFFDLSVTLGKHETLAK